MDKNLKSIFIDKIKTIYCEHAYLKEEDTVMLIFEKGDEVNNKFKKDEIEFKTVTFPVLTDKNTGKILAIYFTKFSEYGNIIDLTNDNGQDYGQKVATK